MDLQRSEPRVVPNRRTQKAATHHQSTETMARQTVPSAVAKQQDIRTRSTSTANAGRERRKYICVCFLLASQKEVHPGQAGGLQLRHKKQRVRYHRTVTPVKLQ